jgi:aryl-alcohol dehydrogenase-like predicted oxidoreductase
MFGKFLLGRNTSADAEIVGGLEELVKKKGVNIAAIGIAFFLANGVIPIVGFGSSEQVDQTAKSIALAKRGLLTKKHIKFLEEKCVAKSVLATW